MSNCQNQTGFSPLFWRLGGWLVKVNFKSPSDLFCGGVLTPIISPNPVYASVPWCADPPLGCKAELLGLANLLILTSGGEFCLLKPPSSWLTSNLIWAIFLKK